jgi:Glycosyl transferase family 2
VLPAGTASRSGNAQVEIVIPVRNEERDLAPSVRRLDAYLRDGFPFATRVTIVDNGSTDGTWAQAQMLESGLESVSALRLDRPGWGGALRFVWSQSHADVACYMDVDLSTDLNALLPLVAPLLSGHSDMAIGTRLARGARVIRGRGPRREIISRCYNLLLHAALGTRFSDAQCGFKAIRGDMARLLLPLTADTSWFFDTELLVLAERAGLRIHEVPVDWIDDADSRVNVRATALADIRGIIRLGSGLARGTVECGQLARHGHSQHRHQPAVHLWDPRPHARRPPPGARPDRVRHRAGSDLRRAGRPARRCRPAGPRCRGGRARRRQSGRHRGEVRPLPDLGLPWPPDAGQGRARPHPTSARCV